MIANKKEVIGLSKRKLFDVLLAVVTAIVVIADKVHDKETEEIE